MNDACRLLLLLDIYLWIPNFPFNKKPKARLSWLQKLLTEITFVNPQNILIYFLKYFSLIYDLSRYLHSGNLQTPTPCLSHRSYTIYIYPLHIYNKDVVGLVTSMTELIVLNITTERILKSIEHPSHKHRSFLSALTYSRWIWPRSSLHVTGLNYVDMYIPSSGLQLYKHCGENIMIYNA